MQKPERYQRQVLQNLDEQFRRAIPDTGDSIYEKLVGDYHLEWVTKAPAGMFSMADKLSIASIGDNHVGLELPLDKPVPMPAKGVAFLAGSMSSGYKVLQVALAGNYPAWQSYLEPATTLHTRRQRIKDGTKNVDRFLTMLFREHASLGPCLRTWPALWDILADEDRRRQGAKPHGKPVPLSSYLAEQFDLSVLTAFVMRIKMELR